MNRAQRGSLLRRRTVLVVLSIALGAAAHSQTAPTRLPDGAPKTAPQVENALPFYEGQNVSSVLLAGRPDIDPQSLLPLLQQRSGQPFTEEKIDASIAALKRTGQFEDVQLEVRPEERGLRILFVLQPAFHFGIYEFPGAKSVSYARLLQVANYPPRGACSAAARKAARTRKAT